MAKWILAAGAAALALTAPALAGPDKNNGGGKGGGKAEHGGGHKAERGNDSGHKADKGNGGGFKAERQGQRFDRGHGGDKKAERFNRGEVKSAKGRDKREARAMRDLDRRDDRVRNDDRRFADNGSGRDFGGFNDNCPPGLAKKNNGCLPPGQAKKMIGASLPASLGSRMLQGPLSQWYRDNDQYMYRNDGDYIYRVNRQGGLIDALFPFQDRDYSYYNVGTAYPADYNFYNVPQQYQSFYADNNDFNYRYGDGAIYQVDRSNNTISSIVALLAGDLGVGQQLPSTYSTYNVPMAYRDRYYDTPDAQYRYNDGYIYRADPKTQLITAVIDALV
ncbi:MAG: hypothetical protein M3R03_01815 [Pseudomonadota bacterium]|nr:hypothetical protein [Pseudomonadota bacterium]